MADAIPVMGDGEKRKADKEEMTNVHGLPQVIRKPKIEKRDHILTIDGKKTKITTTVQKN